LYSAHAVHSTHLFGCPEQKSRKLCGMMTAPEDSCDGVYVVIQAAGMNAQDCAADPVAALAFNGVATVRLVMAASRTGAQRFISLSTAHVYASPLAGTITEATYPRNLTPPPLPILQVSMRC